MIYGRITDLCSIFVGKMCDKSGDAEASGTNTLDTRTCAHLTSGYFSCFLEMYKPLVV